MPPLWACATAVGSGKVKALLFKCTYAVGAVHCAYAWWVWLEIGYKDLCLQMYCALVQRKKLMGCLTRLQDHAHTLKICLGYRFSLETSAGEVGISFKPVSMSVSGLVKKGGVMPCDSHLERVGGHAATQS